MKTQRIEFIGITLLFALIGLFVIQRHFYFIGISELMHVMGFGGVLYASTLFACLWLFPQLFYKRITWSTAVYLLIGIGITWICLTYFYSGITNRGYFRSLFRSPTFWFSVLLYLVVCIYHLIKIGFLYIQKHPDQLKSRILKESIYLFIILLLCSAFRFVSSLELTLILILWISFSYAIYAITFYWWLPMSKQNEFKNWQTILGILGISSFVLLLFFQLCIQWTRHIEPTTFLTGGILLMTCTLPLSFNLWHRYQQRTQQMQHLHQALGQTSADLQFLKSQINPHFLFNILNTLYGIALQENADRTANSIQKLGDMMRFMLHENNQDQILLIKEIEYVENYLELQKLRTVYSEDIQIEANIHHIIGNHYIAPMLLIPFVENAFKHGIRLKRKSWIHLSLYQKEDQLHFYVRNSVHPKQQDDPEREHSGIGLENVKQRLKMLYPGTHELIIRESPEEFYIHLNLPI